MATPIGHGLAGYTVRRLGVAPGDVDARPLSACCVLLSLAADLDFLPGLLLGQPALFHQGPSHSLAFAAGAGLLAVGLYARAIGTNRSPVALWVLFFGAYASHLVLDLFGSDNRAPYGIPLFWPVSETSILSPVHVFRGVRHAGTAGASTGAWLSGIVDLYNAGAILIEVGVVLPFLLLAASLRRPGPASNESGPAR